MPEVEVSGVTRYRWKAAGGLAPASRIGIAVSATVRSTAIATAPGATQRGSWSRSTNLIRSHFPGHHDPQAFAGRCARGEVTHDLAAEAHRDSVAIASWGRARMSNLSIIDSAWVRIAALSNSPRRVKNARSSMTRLYSTLICGITPPRRASVCLLYTSPSPRD